jgi:hypothetical protein
LIAVGLIELGLGMESATHANHSDVVSWGHSAKSEPINDWDWNTHIFVLLKEAASE